MAFASGGFHGLSYTPETVFGETPSTPEMVSLRHTSCSLVLSKDSFQSDELRSDRQISDLRHGVQRVQGDIGIELSYGEYDPLLEMALFGTWNSDVLKVGTTAKSATIERAFADINQYGVFTGCMASSFRLSVTPNSIVTGTITLAGKGATYSGTALDAMPAASLTNSPFDSFSGAILEGGATTAIVTGIEISLDNGLQPAFVIGSNKAAAMTPGRSNLTGTISAYFENLSALNKFINETESSLQFTLGDGAAKSYTFVLPRIKYTGGDNPTNGEGPMVLSMPFQALYDSVTGTNLKITRIP